MDETRTTAEESVTIGKLARDFKVVVQDAEALLKATAGDVGERVRDARERLAASMESAKTNYQAAQGRALEGVKAADKIVRAHPYQSLGVAFGVGVLLGLLVGRK